MTWRLTCTTALAREHSETAATGSLAHVNGSDARIVPFWQRLVPSRNAHVPFSCVPVAACNVVRAVGAVSHGVTGSLAGRPLCPRMGRQCGARRAVSQARVTAKKKSSFGYVTFACMRNEY